MTAPADLIDRVAALVREVSATVIEPRFGHLSEGDVRSKSPGELVTVVDTEAEAALSAGLAAIVGGIPIVGEEACEAKPELVAAAGGDAWVVDPLDGTSNFAAGRPDWAVMVALVRGGDAVASWIWRPTADDGGHLYAAERGGGATCDGVPLRMADPPTPDHGAGVLPRGAVLRRFLAPEVRDALDDRAAGVVTLLPGRHCAGVEYPALITGEQQFVTFWRTLPWDHAPGVLLAAEAGAVVARPDGSRYRPGDAGAGLIAARDDRVWRVARSLLGDG